MSKTRPLKLVHPVHPHSATDQVSVQFQLDARTLVVRFEVHARIHSNSGLAHTESQWGLWEWDVVEVFVNAGTGSTYYEFQVSPLNQYFELEIFEPRKRFNREFRSGFKHEVQTTSEEGWQAELRIPLDKIGWDGKPESIHGNAFAVLGQASRRTYWSLFIGQQAKPDFHLPEFFRALIGHA